MLLLPPVLHCCIDSSVSCVVSFCTNLPSTDLKAKRVFFGVKIILDKGNSLTMRYQLFNVMLMAVGEVANRVPWWGLMYLVPALAYTDSRSQIKTTGKGHGETLISFQRAQEVPSPLFANRASFSVGGTV